MNYIFIGCCCLQKVIILNFLIFFSVSDDCICFSSKCVRHLIKITLKQFRQSNNFANKKIHLYFCKCNLKPIGVIDSYTINLTLSKVHVHIFNHCQGTLIEWKLMKRISTALLLDILFTFGLICIYARAVKNSILTSTYKRISNKQAVSFSFFWQIYRFVL